MKNALLRNMALPHSLFVLFALIFLPFMVLAEDALFFETFDSASRGSYAGAPIIIGDVASWSGTNYVIKAPAGKDHYFGVRSLKTQGKAAYFMMTTDKAGGCGSVSLYHGLQQGSKTDVTWVLSVSTDQGQTWNAYTSETISPTDTFEQITFENINIPGNIRIRIDVDAPKSKERYTCFDNIQITDYSSPGGSDTPDPPSPPGSDDPPDDPPDTPDPDDPDDPPIPDDPDDPDGPEYVVPALGIRSGKTMRETFDSLGGTKEAALPSPWRVSFINELNNPELPYGVASLTTTQYAGTNVSIKTAGIYNIGAGNRDTATDRAVGFLASKDNFRKCALMVPVRNISSIHLSRIHISYSIEKYRTGSAKTIELHTSEDGESWEPAGGAFLTQFAADEGDPEWTDVDPETTRVSGIIPVDLSEGEVLYLGWFYRSRVASEGSNSQVLAIDDVVLKPGDRTIFMVANPSPAPESSEE